MSNSRSRRKHFKIKAQVSPMSKTRRLEVAAQFTDDVLSKLADAFFQVVQQEGWGKRDLSLISGINETAIGHILAGRRKNLTVETIAVLARAMLARPELVLHDLRPKHNNLARSVENQPAVNSAATALPVTQVVQTNAPSATIRTASAHERAGSLRALEVLAQ